MSGGQSGRVGFVPKLKPELVDEYVAAHEYVWPETLEAMAPLTGYFHLD